MSDRAKEEADHAVLLCAVDDLLAAVEAAIRGAEDAPHEEGEMTRTHDESVGINLFCRACGLRLVIDEVDGRNLTIRPCHCQSEFAAERDKLQEEVRELRLGLADMVVNLGRISDDVADAKDDASRAWERTQSRIVIPGVLTR